MNKQVGNADKTSPDLHIYYIITYIIKWLSLLTVFLLLSPACYCHRSHLDFYITCDITSLCLEQSHVNGITFWMRGIVTHSYKIETSKLQIIEILRGKETPKIDNIEGMKTG